MLTKPEHGWTEFSLEGAPTYTLSYLDDIALEWTAQAIHGLETMLPFCVKGFMEPRRLQRNFKCILAQSGLRPANFHTLRHTFATRCAAVTDPKTLSCLLGHSSVSTTMEHYVHPRPEQMRRCLEQLSA